MKLIEQDETEHFLVVLKRFKLSIEDFELAETDTTDSNSKCISVSGTEFQSLAR